MPTKVFKTEKTGNGLLSNGKKNFVKDSGITFKLDIIATNPNPSFLFEILPTALVCSHNQNIPEIA